MPGNRVVHIRGNRLVHFQGNCVVHVGGNPTLRLHRAKGRTIYRKFTWYRVDVHYALKEYPGPIKDGSPGMS